MKKLLLVVLLACTITITIAANKLPNPKRTATHLKLPAFSSVHVTGFVNVIINGSDSKNPTDTIIENHHPHWVRARVRHHVLYLTALEAERLNRKPPTVKIRMYQLNNLSAYGRASIKGKDIKSDGLCLRADTTRNITLTGNMTVHCIYNYGSGGINLRWVKGSTITLLGLHGNIRLAGNVDTLSVKLRNHAVLDAQYLRTNHVLIQTKNFAAAKVLPVQSLRAFATDFSNVYYYKTPEHISRHSTRSGNILQLGKSS